MATINLFLERSKPDKEGYCQVYLQLNHKSKKRKYFIGSPAKIKESDWNPKRQRMKGDNKKANDINDFIAHYENVANKVVADAIREFGRDISIEALWDFIMMSFHAKEEVPVNKVTLTDLIQASLQRQQGNFKKNTICNYQTLLYLIDQCEVYHNQRFYIDSIKSGVFYERFKHYYLSVRENENSGFNLLMSKIKAVINYLRKSGYLEEKGISIPSEHVSLPKLKEHYNIEYIRDYEIKAIYNTCFIARSKTRNGYGPHRPMEETKDMFVFLCYTGIRSSDYKSLRKEQIIRRHNTKTGKDYYVIRVMQTKTTDLVEVPLNTVCLEILRKYNYHLPKRSSESMNTNLHKMLKQLGIFNDLVEHVSLRGTQQIKSLVPRYDLLTVHTARHTFAMYLLKKGMNVKKVQQLLGHKHLATTMKYVHKLENEDVHADALEMLNI